MFGEEYVRQHYLFFKHTIPQRIQAMPNDVEPAVMDRIKKANSFRSK